tara:strand:+ start:20 stop:517 length:498 start_codon:yes stop_codon:yes gene_type:complete
MNIGDFAEQLIESQVANIQKGTEALPQQETQLAPAGVDIRGTQVPDEMRKQILGESFYSQDSPSNDSIPELVWSDSEEEKEVQNPSVLTEETAQELIPLLNEVRSLLKEMTAAGTFSGNIGVNLAGPQKDDESWANIEKGYGYKTPKTKKDILKKALRTKVQKRR